MPRDVVAHCDRFSGHNVTLNYGTASVGYYFADHWAFDVHDGIAVYGGVMWTW